MQRLFEIRETPLSLDECFQAVMRPEAGGVVLFIGTVRDHNAGQPVTALEYQAYAPMAQKELAAIAQELEAGTDVRLACLHRVGQLQVGDLAVICAASSPHRGEAFKACQDLIDRLKARVPIWKREHGEAGPYWIGWQDVRSS
jgi:molybdopterin synthase catalytic subunit